MATEAGDMAGGAGRGSSRRLHAQHIRYLLQDPHCPWHGTRHSSFHCSRQATRPPRWYGDRNSACLCNFLIEMFALLLDTKWVFLVFLTTVSRRLI